MTAMTDVHDDKVGGAMGREIKDESAISVILLTVGSTATVKSIYWSKGTIVVQLERVYVEIYSCRVRLVDIPYKYFLNKM